MVASKCSTCKGFAASNGVCFAFLCRDFWVILNNLQYLYRVFMLQCQLIFPRHLAVNAILAAIAFILPCYRFFYNMLFVIAHLLWVLFMARR